MRRWVSAIGTLALILGSSLDAAAQLRIMNLGSNEVVGNDGYASYRYDFWFRLLDAGYDVDFVGRIDTDRDLPSEFSYPRYFEDYDRDYQAYYNRAILEIADEVRSAAAETPPDVAVVTLGPFELRARGEDGLASADEGIRTTIGFLREANPNVLILLNTRPPGTFQGSHLIPQLNEVIARVATETNTAASPVVLVDLHTGYPDYYNSENGWMPNAQGEDFIANRLMIALTAALEEPRMVINLGLNDAWFEPATSGQGFLLSVFPAGGDPLATEGSVFLAWYSYDMQRPAEDVDALIGDPGHRWFTAFGSYSGNTATLELYVTQGGVFDAEQPQPTTTSEGTILLTFNDCASGTVDYDMPSAGLSGTIPIQRVSNNNVAFCESLLQLPQAQRDRE